jgi:hypothetical protein
LNGYSWVRAPLGCEMASASAGFDGGAGLAVGLQYRLCEESVAGKCQRMVTGSYPPAAASVFGTHT